MNIDKTGLIFSLIFLISSTSFALAQSENCGAGDNKFVESATVNLGFENSVAGPKDGRTKYNELKKQIEIVLKDSSFKSLELSGVNYSVNVMNAYLRDRTYQLSGSFIYNSQDIDAAYNFIEKIKNLDLTPTISVDKTKVESCVNE